MRNLRFIVTLILFSSLAIAARASSVGTLNVRQGTTVVSPSIDVIGDLQFNFNGPNFSITGSGTVTNCGFCVTSAPPGLGPLSGNNVISNSGPDIGSVTLGAVVYDNVLFHGVVTIVSSKTFNLPSASQPTFTVTLPVTFSGQLLACPVSPDFNTCASADIAAFNFQQLHGTVKIDFINNGQTYSFDKGVYTIAPVPEPTTLMLVGIGSVLVGMRRKQVRRVSADHHQG